MSSRSPPSCWERSWAPVRPGASRGARGARSTAWPGVTAASLALELVVVVAWAIGWTFTGGNPGRAATYLLIAVAAVAMGLQSSAAGHVGIGGVSTAYITGTLSALASQLTQRPARVREAVLRAGIVLAYLGGAAPVPACARSHRAQRAGCRRWASQRRW